MKEEQIRFEVSLTGKQMVNSFLNREEMLVHYEQIKNTNPTYQLNFDQHCVLFLCQQVVNEMLAIA